MLIDICRHGLTNARGQSLLPHGAVRYRTGLGELGVLVDKGLGVLVVAVGLDVRDTVGLGAMAGIGLGMFVGADLGVLVGAGLGVLVVTGVDVVLVGAGDGVLVGGVLGILVGATLGALVGADVGVRVGAGVGEPVGAGVSGSIGAEVRSVSTLLKLAALSGAPSTGPVPQGGSWHPLLTTPLTPFTNDTPVIPSSTNLCNSSM